MTTEWLRSIIPSTINYRGIDRKSSIIRGIVLAEQGIFKDRRGRFSQAGLEKIVEVANRSDGGLKTRWTHPTLSNDGLGTFLGRTKNIHMSTVSRDGIDVPAARGDLHLSPTSFSTPKGNLGDYVMRLTDDDPDAINMSLVLRAKQEYELNADGTAKKGDDGKALPPYWLATDVHAVDVVDTGAATNSMLSENYPELSEQYEQDILVQASALLLEKFGGQSREFVESRLRSWCERALDLHWPKSDSNNEMMARLRKARLRKIQALIDSDD